MLFKRFEESGLCHYSYAVGSSQLGQIAVIDPGYDVEPYLNFAEQNRAIISHVLETHIHGDHASGARRLANRTGASLVLSSYDKGEAYEVGFLHRECKDGDLFILGEISLKALYTPGHTPEHLSFLVMDKGKPLGLFSGDFLLFGSVGYPDLVEEEAAVEQAKKFYYSLRNKLKDLPDSIEIFPAHGAGSFCGSKMRAQSSSTLGQERAANPFLNPSLTEEEFISLFLKESIPQPDYFSRLKSYNSMSIRGGIAIPVPIEPQLFRKKVEKGAFVIDLRDQQHFSLGHVPGALCIGEGRNLGFWAARAIPGNTPILLVTHDLLKLGEAIESLAQVGLFHVEGYLKNGMEGWKQENLPLELTAAILPDELNAVKDRVEVIDVRSHDEWVGGHISGSKHIPCNELPERAEDLPEGDLVFVCAGGYRSILAASIAQKWGRKEVSHLPGGILAWRNARLPLVN